MWGGEEPLEKGMAIHSSIFVWRIPWTEEPGRLQTMGCKELNTTEATQQQKYKVEPKKIIIKNRIIIVKAMVFAVVMYGCES